MVWWRLCAYRERQWAGLGDARDEGDAIWAMSCGGGGAGQRFHGELRSGARHGSAFSSPWRVDGRPRRARREMAPRGEAERLRENQRRGKRRGQWRGDVWLGTDVETANGASGGLRGACQPCEVAREERFRAKPGAREADLAGGTARVRRVADAGGERRHGEK